MEALGSDMTQTAFKFLTTWAHPHQVKRLGRARLARWFQRETRKSWGPRRAGDSRRQNVADGTHDSADARHAMAD